MKRFLLLGFWIGAAAAGTLSRTHITTSNEVTYVIPAGSPVRYERTGEYDTVHYKGRFQLRGNYEYGYVTDDPEADSSYRELFLTFSISKAAAAKLPYWSRDGGTTEIEIRNPGQFALAVAGPTNVARLRRHEIKKVSGTATIVVDGFRTTVECDHQISSAQFISVAVKPHRNVAMLLADEPGC